MSDYCPLVQCGCHIPRPGPVARLEAFGPRRIMWGSDYPPVSSREGYLNSLRTPQEYLAQLS